MPENKVANNNFQPRQYNMILWKLKLTYCDMVKNLNLRNTANKKFETLKDVIEHISWQNFTQLLEYLSNQFDQECWKMWKSAGGKSVRRCGNQEGDHAVMWCTSNHPIT